MPGRRWPPSPERSKGSLAARPSNLPRPHGRRWGAGRDCRSHRHSGMPATRLDGMVNGMATKKVTVTLDETQLDRIRALVEAGSASSVSGFVQHSVEVALDDVAGWGALLAEALRQTGGTLSEEERAWADGILGL